MVKCTYKSLLNIFASPSEKNSPHLSEPESESNIQRELAATTHLVSSDPLIAACSSQTSSLLRPKSLSVSPIPLNHVRVRPNIQQEPVAIAYPSIRIDPQFDRLLIFDQRPTLNINVQPSRDVFLANIVAAPSGIPLRLSNFSQSKVRVQIQHPTRTCHHRQRSCILDNPLHPLFYTPTPSISLYRALDSAQEPCCARRPSEPLAQAPLSDRPGNPTTLP